MMHLNALTCPACGGKLQNTQNGNRLICAHCGSEYLAQRPPADKTAAELAVARLAREVNDLQTRWESLRWRSNGDWIPPSMLEVMLPLVALGGLLFFVFSMTPISWAALPMAVICLVWSFRLRRKRLCLIQEIRMRELVELQTRLHRKRALLAQNRRIVEP